MQLSARLALEPFFFSGFDHVSYSQLDLHTQQPQSGDVRKRLQQPKGKGCDFLEDARRGTRLEKAWIWVASLQLTLCTNAQR